MTEADVATLRSAKETLAASSAHVLQLYEQMNQK